MKERQEYTETIEVPKGTGRQGFLLALDQILKLPRVQGIQVDARGKVHYTRYIEEGETPVPVQIDFETISPHSVIRNAPIQEVPESRGNAAATIGSMFDWAVRDQLHPIAFVGGANSCLVEWYETSANHTPYVLDDFFGLPFYKDRMIEDYMLFLCVGYARGGALIDTQKSYKFLMPERIKAVTP